MTSIGVFRRNDFDPGAYAVALFHAQEALAGPDQAHHRLSLHTFTAGGLRHTAGAAGVDALLAFGPDQADLDYLRQCGRPSVVCERVVEGCSFIAPDNEDMGRVAARHLLDLGHTDLAVALPGERATLGEYHGTRLRGFLDACAAAGHPVADENVLFASKDVAGGEDVAARLLARPSLPGALFVQNLSLTLGLLDLFRERGVRVPADLSLVGTSFSQLNAHEAAGHTDPPFTAVTFEKEQMGSRGVRYLIDAAEGRARGLWQVRLPGVLVVRRSTAPARVAVA